MIDQGTLERLLAPARDRGVTVRFGCGEVVGTSGSALVVAAKSGGTVYAENYAYAERGDVVCYIASGPNVVAFASKDQARLANEMEQAGIAYKGGYGITIEGTTISAEVAMSDIPTDLPVSFFEAL